MSTYGGVAAKLEAARAADLLITVKTGKTGNHTVVSGKKALQDLLAQLHSLECVKGVEKRLSIICEIDIADLITFLTDFILPIIAKLLHIPMPLILFSVKELLLIAVFWIGFLAKERY